VAALAASKSVSLSVSGIAIGIRFLPSDYRNEKPNTDCDTDSDSDSATYLCGILGYSAANKVWILGRYSVIREA
jgi:hypothetical protein